MSRENAYRLVQTHAMTAWQNETNFREAISGDPEIKALLSPDKLAEAFDYHRQLRTVDAIFNRVLHPSSKS